MDAYQISSIKEVHAITEDWLNEYTAIRPHDALIVLPLLQITAEKLQKVST